MGAFGKGFSGQKSLIGNRAKPSKVRKEKLTYRLFVGPDFNQTTPSNLPFLEDIFTDLIFLQPIHLQAKLLKETLDSHPLYYYNYRFGIRKLKPGTGNFCPWIFLPSAEKLLGGLGW